MQNALAELRKNQERAPEREEPAAGAATPQAKAGATDAAAVEGEKPAEGEQLPETDAPEGDLETVTEEGEVVETGDEGLETGETGESTIIDDPDAEAVAVERADDEEEQ